VDSPELRITFSLQQLHCIPCPLTYFRDRTSTVLVYHISYKRKMEVDCVMSQQNELANQLAQRVGVTPEQANTAINIVTRTLLQKAEPTTASSLLSKLPSGITSIFSDNEKQQFTSSRQNVSNEEVVQRVKNEARISDDRKAQQTTEEAVKLLQEKTGEEGLMANVMGKFKKMDLNPFD